MEQLNHDDTANKSSNTVIKSEDYKSLLVKDDTVIIHSSDRDIKSLLNISRTQSEFDKFYAQNRTRI